MPNRLAGENSPYLLQHKENPVDWYPWGPEALAKAGLENKPIFLSIGYAACHWCHVMAHESFEDPDIAAFMNEHFVNIKVDREQRPDLDSIYMNAVVAMTGSGGWPMSVFLTPEGKPFYGGTYFPPVRRYNMPSFREVLTSVSRVWQQDRAKIMESSENITRHILESGDQTGIGQPLSPEALDQAALNLAQNYDWKNGGWGGAPKFPQPMSIEFLLRRAARGDKLALDVAVHALQAMAQGGMYDVVGGGFARYSTDEYWLVPHFEKMLYDNAQLALAYLHGYLVCRSMKTKSSAPSEGLDRTALFFRGICEAILDFVNREMTHHSNNASEAGGFYSSLDADSEGEEGKFYLWTLDEICEILTPSTPGGAPSPTPTEDLEFFIAAYGVTEKGNFEGKTVLQRALEDNELAQRFGMSIEAVPSRLERLHARLLEVRNQRPRPGTDDKVLTSWNALMLIAFAEAARYLKRDDYKSIAIRNAGFLLKELTENDQLLRSWRAGKASHPAYLEDHAALILALLALYQTDTDPRWFHEAHKLTLVMLDHFKDPQGGFFDTRDDGEVLLSRPKDLQDNATPSGSAMATMALLQLSAYTGNGEWRDLAEVALGKIQALARRYPTGFGYWLSTLDFALAEVKEVAILGEAGDAGTQALAEVLWNVYRPNLVAAISAYPPKEGSPELLKDRLLLDGLSTAYVCRNFICQRPVTRAQELKELLGD